MHDWGSPDPTVENVVAEQSDACLAVYREDPSRVEQDANNELRISQGGYARRQLFELLQNAVDATQRGGSRIEVVLTTTRLMVANDGEPFNADGVRALMASDLSRKDDDRIGRFGIGFKSVLAVSSRPAVYSRSVSFVFDAAWAEQKIRDEGFLAPRYPAMRLARTERAVDAAASDPELEALMSWASTVVVLPIDSARADIKLQIHDLAPEFVLFSEHLHSVVLRDESGTSHLRRDITRTADTSGRAVLEVSGERQVWTVVSIAHQPGAAAMTDAGKIAARDSVKLTWAVQTAPSRVRLGKFWAYFPTKAQTTLSGIVNAPFKLSDDRTDLLEGSFNHELLAEVLPGLLRRALPDLHNPESPGAYLDLLPARGREERSWADDVINVPVYEGLAAAPSIPDGNGTLRLPRDLKMVPEGITKAWAEAWQECDGAPLDDWVHCDVLTADDRRSKARRLVGDRPENNPSVAEWLEALAGAGTVHASANAIRLAARIMAEAGELKESAARDVIAGVQSARVVRLEDGTMFRPTRGRVFVRTSADDSGHTFVDPALAADDDIRNALQRLGVVVLDRSGELRALLTRARSGADVWQQVWSASRAVSHETAVELFREELIDPLALSVRVRTAAGRWRLMASVYLGGVIVPADGRRDRDVLIDPKFHAEDRELLEAIGAVANPVWRTNSPRERWFANYEQAARDAFVRKATGSKPSAEKLVLSGESPGWPLQPLEELSIESRLEMTRFILARGTLGRWSVEHATNASYGRIEVLSPETWLLRKYAAFETPFGLLAPGKVLVQDDAYPPGILPVADVSTNVATALGIRTSPEEFERADWLWLKKIADDWTEDDRRHEFYTWLPGRIEPQSLVVRVGPRREVVPLENIGVTSERAVYDALLDAHVPAMWVASEEDVTDRFIGEWGMKRGKELLQQEIVATPAGEAELLLDAYPPLKLHLEPEDHEIRLQSCSRLVRMVATPRGQIERPLASLRDGDRVLVTGSKDEVVLEQVGRALNLELDARGVARILEQMAAAQTNALKRLLKKATDDDGRLVAAVGLEALKRCVPSQALTAITKSDGSVDPREVAALARAVHGVGLLRQLRPVLEERGLTPPREWTGRRASREFVTGLGFPAEWAGFPTSERPAIQVIDGPVDLKPLHDYQLFVTERIKALLAGIGKDRGVVSLPTGAGKTRVTVEALVDEIASGRVRGPLVWIAQSDELCEQAAETWTYVWRAKGPASPMSLGRLWGSNEVSEEPGTFQLVIATVDKLASVADRGGYDWLTDPTVIVVDEAHTSIAASYTKVLEWMGRGRSRKEFRPLIGLTATPFRGTSTDETTRLVNRYDGNRLDRGAFGDDPYGELQDMGVLATVRQTLLDGVDVALGADDLDEISKYRRIPRSVESRLGEDVERTKTIVESIVGLPADWTVLLFAPSVENARTVAALLAHRGVSAVAIDSATEPSVRRHYVDEFKAGRIRVITNYMVLAQGFDAPAVRAVYVTRPTFSPNVYQQMIGRGLRGPLNGGSDEVLIVNVKDNFTQFGELLAFRDFEYLWKR